MKLVVENYIQELNERQFELEECLTKQMLNKEKQLNNDKLICHGFDSGNEVIITLQDNLKVNDIVSFRDINGNKRQLRVIEVESSEEYASRNNEKSFFKNAYRIALKVEV